MDKDWKELSEAASREQDPKKLLELVEQLDQALEQCENAMREKHRAPEKSDASSTFSPELFGDVSSLCA